MGILRYARGGDKTYARDCSYIYSFVSEGLRRENLHGMSRQALRVRRGGDRDYRTQVPYRAVATYTAYEYRYRGSSCNTPVMVCV